MRWRRVLLGLSCVAALFVSACGGGAPQLQSRSDRRPRGPLPIRFDELRLVAFGGFTDVSPPGSECFFQSHRHTFRLDVVSHTLHWDLCNSDDGEPERAVGDMVLSAAEFEQVQHAVGAVRAGDMTSCGVDAGILVLELRTGTNVSTYVDDFYAGCPGRAYAGSTFVAGLMDLFTTLDVLSQ